jgi:hypothetical protein
MMQRILNTLFSVPIFVYGGECSYVSIGILIF